MCGQGRECLEWAALGHGCGFMVFSEDFVEVWDYRSDRGCFRVEQYELDPNLFMAVLMRQTGRV